MLDWGMCGTIVAVIAFGYSIWVEHKLKKLNDHVADLHRWIETLGYIEANKNGDD